jgi:hypothetical protein
MLSILPRRAKIYPPIQDQPSDPVLIDDYNGK